MQDPPVDASAATASDTMTPRVAPPERPLLLFDGVCNLCHGAVRFVLAHERDASIRFASLQSEAGRAVLRGCGVDPDALDSVVFVERGEASMRSDAVLRLSRHLERPWSWLRAFRLVPRPIRDAAYDFIASRRYRWFGRQDACSVPVSGDEASARLVESVEDLAEPAAASRASTGPLRPETEGEGAA